MHTARVRISDDGLKVILFFSHRDFLNARFDYRAKAPDEDDHEKLWLAEELATKALHRIMRDTTSAADPAETTWLRMHGQRLRVDSSARAAATPDPSSLWESVSDLPCVEGPTDQCCEWWIPLIAEVALVM